MPIQKGKHRKRPRRRNTGMAAAHLAQVEAPAPVRSAKRSSRPIMRRGWEPPMWVNLLIGGFLFILGIVFSVTSLASHKGTSIGWNLIILVGYFALAGLYLGKAFRQYRKKQQS